MKYKCNNCKDVFSLNEQTIWSVYCFHCGKKGILNFLEFEDEEAKQKLHTSKTRKVSNK